MKVKKLSKRLVIAISLGAILLAVTTYKGVSGVSAYGRTAQDTPPPVAVVPLAPVGRFDEIHTKAKNGDWQARIMTKGMSDVHIVEVTIQPGKALGWHSHLGPSFVIVKSGNASIYDADDPTCTRDEIPAGSSLFEPAGHVHIVRNEGIEPLVNVVFQLIPAGAPRLIPEPNPGNCPF